MVKLLLMTLLLLPLTVAAAGEKIYRTVDEDGNVVYTDQPPSDDAEPVKLDPITTVPAIETDSNSERDVDDEEDEPAAPRYDRLEIVYPTVDEAIRHNGGQVPFQLELKPEGVELDDGHRVEILLDGSVQGSGNSLTVTVGPVDRGPHEVSARVVDAGGNVLAQSQTVNFFLLRHSVQP